MDQSPTSAIQGSNTLVDATVEWLMAQALGATSAERLLEECALRLNAAGIPLWRANLGFQILHPLYQALAYTWYRDDGLRPVARFNIDADTLTEQWRASPQNYLVQKGLPFLRRRLTGPQATFDFPVLEDLRAAGGTDYLCYLVPFGGAPHATVLHDGMVGSWATDRPGGFDDDDIRQLMRIQTRLGVACKMVTREQITRNVLSAYLGPEAGKKVLSGQIKLGDGDTIYAVIWFSDLRDSSGLADTMSGADYLDLVNAYFGCTAGAVLANGGEVLRFVGDAVLAIFAVGGATGDRPACARALDAVREAEHRLGELNRRRAADHADPIDFGVGLHIGDLMYGNIGIPERIEFSVIGPAANEVARLEDLTKTLGSRVLVSDRFVEASASGAAAFRSLGRHALRGVGEPMEVFVPAEMPSADVVPLSEKDAAE